LKALEALNPFKSFERSHLTVEVDPQMSTNKITNDVPRPVGGGRDGRNRRDGRHARHSTEVDAATLAGLPPLPPAAPQKSVESVLNIKHAIGSGAFGVVFLAELGDTHELVAVKKVLQDRRYKNREHEIISSLKHPNIVALKNVFHTTDTKDDGVYLNLVLEYLPENLHQVIKSYRSHGPIPETLIKVYLYQLCRSLAYLHAKGICHRDLKPQNILVDRKTHILKLCDFGSAKKLVKHEANVAYICSRFYRAPELIFGSEYYTTAIDMWSVGCICAELALGHPLFAGDTGIDQLVEIFKVLGSPTVEEVYAMNSRGSEYDFPKVSATPWERVFPAATPEYRSFISHLLRYNPTERLDPLSALAHPFFDELREELVTLPNEVDLPPLFNFTLEEMSLDPLLVEYLIPNHARSETNWPVKEILMRSKAVEVYKIPHPSKYGSTVDKDMVIEE